MDELYTELALEKIHNQVTEQDTKKLNHYTELFDKCKSNKNIDSSDCHKQNSLEVKRPKKEYLISESKRTKSDKILMKADPGMGKTTQCKKISFDWAVRLFTYFHIVFLVFLKLVKPGETIENVIIKQNPYIKGLKITEQKLCSILDALGSDCLLILDGLDEHVLGTNEDVLSIIRGEKYLKCNVIVTSRPHSTREIERYFPKVVRVEGFTKNKAKQFASKILTDERQIDNVLNFSPADLREDIPIHKCPILLSFICLLVKEDHIDLSDKTIDIGEIYFRMVRCLYKKFTIRKGREFKESEFIKVLRLVGKLALQTLLSDDPLLLRSRVTEEVGPEAFDYGLLIGHEDPHRLVRDETTDIWVTFPHRTIQEFLGALYFVMMLDKGEIIKTILGDDDINWIFMKNPLFLQFCLWVLRNGEKCFNFQRCQDVKDKLRDFCVKVIYSAELDLTKIRGRYAALDVKLAYDRKSEFYLEFLNDVIVRCDGVSYLVINYDDPLGWIINCMKPLLTGVRYIKCEQGSFSIVSLCFDILISYVKGTDIVLKISHLDLTAKLDTILEGCAALVDNHSVYLYLDRSYALSGEYAVNFSRLFVRNQGHSEWNSFSYPNLTHLCLERVYGGPNTPYLALPISDYFPMLQNISLLSCTGTNVWLQSFFHLPWKQLQHLNLLKSQLSETDLEFLCLACNGPEKTLPNLTSLYLSLPIVMKKETLSSKLFALSWQNLKSFFVDCLLAIPDIHDSFHDAITSEKLQNLISLAIQLQSADQRISVRLPCIERLCNLKSLHLFDFHSDIQIPMDTLLRLNELSIYSHRNLTGRTTVMFPQPLPFLDTLTLRHCGLNSQDLITLRKANVEDRLPSLKHLHLSDNEIVYSEFMCLFDDSCPWNQLLSMNIINTFHTYVVYYDGDSDKLLDRLDTVVKRGGLSSLQRLGINYYKYQNTNTIWPKLEKLHVLFCNEDSLRNLSNSVQSRLLPKLQTLCIERYPCCDASITHKLSEMGVSCHKFCSPWDNPFKKCHCEET